MFDLPPVPDLWRGPPPAQLVEIQRPIEQVGAVCRALGVKTTFAMIYGCSTWARGGCVIVIPQVQGPVTAQFQARVREHEIAHCNGWPAHHPEKGM